MPLGVGPEQNTGASSSSYSVEECEVPYNVKRERGSGNCSNRELSSTTPNGYSTTCYDMDLTIRSGKVNQTAVNGVTVLIWFWVIGLG